MMYSEPWNASGLFHSLGELCFLRGIENANLWSWLVSIIWP